MIASALALLLMQVGPDPTQGSFPGIPEELRDRPQRESVAAPPAYLAVIRWQAGRMRYPGDGGRFRSQRYGADLA